ncbi:MAG TPA: hypothetical protein VK933_13035 [Longimicrobiales bacterium]|nr:hypothetical protein [Longimicrobiales bacterium]
MTEKVRPLRIGQPIGEVAERVHERVHVSAHSRRPLERAHDAVAIEADRVAPGPARDGGHDTAELPHPALVVGEQHVFAIRVQPHEARTPAADLDLAQATQSEQERQEPLAVRCPASRGGRPGP